MRVLLSGMEWLPDLPGGLNRYFHGLVGALPGVGVRGTAMLSYVTAKNPPPSGEQAPIRVAPMAEHGAGLRRVWKGARAIARDELRGDGLGVDLANVHFALYAVPWVRMLPRNVPLVVHFHGPWAEEVAAEAAGPRGWARAFVARRLERFVYRRATRFVTLSRAFADILERQYKVPPERIRIVPGGVDLGAYLAAPTRAEARARLGWPSDRPNILSVRRLVRRVGLEGLIDAMREVHRRVPDALLHIGGEGPLGAELVARAADAGLAEHVRFLGRVQEDLLPTVYAAADVSVVPTVKLEGFGMVTAESLAAGTPVLGTPIGGTTEVLRGLDPSLIFESLSPEAMADRIVSAIDGHLRLPGREACQDYAKRYDWRTVIHQIRAVFDEARRGA